MKVKLIDLFNKIVNDELEDGFKVLRHGNYIMVYNRAEKEFKSENGIIQFTRLADFALNEELEIIEEDKEIKEIKIGMGLTEVDCAYKINELVKAVNKLKKGK